MAVPYSRYVIGSIPWYSFLIVLGVALAYFIGSREEKRVGLPPDTMVDVTLIAVPCGIVGARLYYVAMEWREFAAHPLSILYVWQGGVAIYGAVIGGAVGVYLYCRRKGVSYASVLDIATPGLLLAQALGRWGNYFNMEAYGPVIENPAFQFFPLGVLIDEGGAYVWHMATFFYESMWNVCGFLALLGMRKRQKQAGSLFLWYLLFYGSGRFIIEQLRTDSLWLGGIKASQGLSLLLCAVAAGMLLWRAGKHRKGALAIAWLMAALALARWFCLSSWAYLGALLLMAALGAYGCGSGALSAPREAKGFPALWPLLPLLLDALGWMLARTQFVPVAFGAFLHAAICSLTLSFYVLWLQQRLGLRASTEGEVKCPSER